jgi:hypothetical protein
MYYYKIGCCTKSKLSGIISVFIARSLALFQWLTQSNNALLQKYFFFELNILLRSNLDLLAPAPAKYTIIVQPSRQSVWHRKKFLFDEYVYLHLTIFFRTLLIDGRVYPHSISLHNKFSFIVMKMSASPGSHCLDVLWVWLEPGRSWPESLDTWSYFVLTCLSQLHSRFG